MFVILFHQAPLRGQIGSAPAERNGETAVDDPDLLDVGGDERWQEAIQRQHQRGRLLEPDIVREIADGTRPTSSVGIGSGPAEIRASGTRTVVPFGLEARDVDGERDADELPHRAFHAQQSVRRSADRAARSSDRAPPSPAPSRAIFSPSTRTSIESHSMKRFMCSVWVRVLMGAYSALELSTPHRQTVSFASECPSGPTSKAFSSSAPAPS